MIDESFCEQCQDFEFKQDGYCFRMKHAKMAMRKAIPRHKKPPWDNPMISMPTCLRKLGFVIIDYDRTDYKTVRCNESGNKEVID